VKGLFDNAKSQVQESIKTFMAQGVSGNLFDGRVKSALETQLEAELKAINLSGGLDEFKAKRKKEIEDMLKGLASGSGGAGGGGLLGFFGDGIRAAMDAAIKEAQEKKKQLHALLNIDFAGVALQGSQEAAAAVARFRWEGQIMGEKTAADEQLKTQRDMLKELREANKKQRAEPPKVFVFG